MTWGWVVVGTLAQLMLGLFLFMLVVFSASSMDGVGKLARVHSRILALSPFGLPATCVVSAGIFVLTMVGGGLGAATRFIVDGLIMRRAGAGFPWGTFTINSSGSLLLGLLTGLAGSSLVDADAAFVLGVGFLGAYTTFSTAMVDTVHMLQKRTFGRAGANAVVMLLVSVGLAAAGLAIGRSV